MTTGEPYFPAFTPGEWLKFHLIPPGLYVQYLDSKHRRTGEAELRLLAEIVPADRVAIDVGANKGVYTRALARIASHVHAFEPNPKAFRWLNRALPKNVSAHPLALSDRDGRTDMYVPKRGRGFSNQMGSLSPARAADPHGQISVDARTLDACAFSNVGFIKIDVEGFEMQVLAGARGTIAHFKPVLLIELEERHTDRKIEDLIGDVAAFGYSAHFVDGGGIKPIAAFDPETRHRNCATKDDYVFNFIFQPL